MSDTTAGERKKISQEKQVRQVKKAQPNSFPHSSKVFVFNETLFLRNKKNDKVYKAVEILEENRPLYECSHCQTGAIERIQLLSYSQS